MGGAEDAYPEGTEGPMEDNISRVRPERVGFLDSKYESERWTV